jgi:AcrR family transcriptional regulator
MKPTRRARIHEATRQEIKAVAWGQIAEHGTAALSLRAIAREMGITAPALYRYYQDRDALVTALIVDAFTSLGDTQIASIIDLPTDDHAGRLKATGLAYREWALAYPQRYLLIFGTPLPGYHAPVEITQPVAARSLRPLIEVLDAAWKDGTLEKEMLPELSDKLRAQIKEWASLQLVEDEHVLYLALVIWSRVHGLVMIEISNQYPPSIEETAEIFYREIELILKTYKTGAVR